MFNEKAGVLDDADDDNDVDLASQAFQIWSNAIKADKKLKEIIPQMQNMVYSTRLADENGVEGVVTYARTANDFDVLTWLDKDGNIISQSQQRILQALACHPETQAQQPLDNHHELVGKAVGITANRLSATLAVCLATVFPHATHRAASGTIL